jgi:integrase
LKKLTISQCDEIWQRLQDYFAAAQRDLVADALGQTEKLHELQITMDQRIALQVQFEGLKEKEEANQRQVEAGRATAKLGDDQARRLLEAPAPDTLKGTRDRAILATLLYHGIRREELCKLRVGDMQTRGGIMHFRVEGKRDKIRFVPVHPTAQRLISVYLAVANHGGELDGALFRPVKNNRTSTLDKHLDPGSIYRNIVVKYGRTTGINAEVNGLCVHSMRATARMTFLPRRCQKTNVPKGPGMSLRSSHCARARS